MYNTVSQNKVTKNKATKSNDNRHCQHYQTMIKITKKKMTKTSSIKHDYNTKQQAFNKESNDAIDWRREGGMSVEPEACIPPPQRDS